MIPVRDGGPLLTRAVSSALAQRDVDLEVIVVDDGSRDDQRAYVPDDSRVVVLQRPPRGVSAARNAGIAAARGRHVALLDADDEWADGLHLRDLSSLLDAEPGWAIAQSGWTAVDEDGTVRSVRTPWTDSPQLDLAAWVRRPTVLPSAMVVRRAALVAVGGFDEDLDQAEDVDLVWRLGRAGWVGGWLTRVTTSYRVSSSSASRRLDRQEACLLTIYSRLFADPDLPADVRSERRPAMASLHCWLAAAYRRAGRTRDAMEHLAASTVWFDETNPLRLAREWAARDARSAIDAGQPEASEAALLRSEPYRRLVAMSPLQLMELGVRRTRTVGSRRPPRVATFAAPAEPAASAPRSLSPVPAVPVAAAPRRTGRVDLTLARARGYGRHRSGWAATMAAIDGLHEDGAPLLDPFVEHTWAPDGTPLPAGRPWVGFVHNPAGQPAWYPIDQRPERLLADARFVEAMSSCVGLVALSEQLASWWRARVDVPVAVVAIPDFEPTRRFSMAALEANPVPRLVQVGSWLRRMHAVSDIPTRVLVPTIVHQHVPWVDVVIAAERERFGAVMGNRVEVLPWLADEDYDDLLAANVVFLELLGASANNCVVECITRGTPLLVNPLPAVREYLGDDYPLYWATHREAARKAEDLDLLRAAHEHLVALDASGRFAPEAFVAAVASLPFLGGGEPSQPVDVDAPDDRPAVAGSVRSDRSARPEMSTP